ncbi:TPA: hypothetical protein R1X69_001095 [Campylobacter upsaliensis]|nr:hypothetical protein [Campylobacter upsaliensis]
MQFNFNFEAFEQSGKEKSEAINYLKGLNSSLDFDKLESDLKGDENAIYEALKGGNFSFSKPSIEQTRQKLLKNKENEALKAEFNTSLSWLDNKQDYNFYDFKKAKERANSKQGLIKADLKAQEKELKRKEALFEKRLKNENIFTKSLRDTADNLGLNAVADTLEMGLNKLGFKDENYIFESEKEDIKKRALKGVREKLERGDLEFNEREKHALRSKYDELDYKKALEKEKEKLRLIQKDSGYNKSEVEFMEEELGFFHTLFNEAKDTVREFKDEYKSEGVIGADVQKAVNVLKQFEESELLRHIFSDKEKKQELQQEYLKNALVIAELNGFDDVGLSRENELYFIKKDKDKEQKYLVNTGFLDNFWDLIENAKFEIAGAFAGGAKGFNSGKSAKGKVVKSILGAAAGSFGGALMDAKIADMYLNRESNYKRNLEYALQAGLLSIAGDGVIIAAKPMAKGVAKGVKNAYAYAKERTPLGLFSTIPSQNINAANKIIDEVFTPEMKEELKQAQKEYGGGVRGEDLANPVFEKLKESFVKKYGKEDIKTQKIAKLAEIFNQNSLKTKQQEMLDLIRSDKDGSTLAYLLEVAKDDVKIQNNLKNMLNLASLNVEKNLKNLNINPREIKSILDEFEAGNKAAFKEVESQISKLYNEDIRVVLDRTQYENIKKDFLENGVNLDEMTPFLRDLENNVFAKEGVTFAKLNNFRKNLNYYIFNKDKTPNFINTLKKISETSLKAEIDKGIDNIFNELPNAYASIKELYSTSLKDYAAMKELNESIKNLKLQDSAKSADEVVDSLIKYAKGQGENGVNNLQKIKDYLGEENNAFLEMQILNRLFKESVVENDRAKVRVFDSEGFLGRVRELVGENELYERNELNGLSSGKLKEILQSWDLSKENNANKKLRQIVSKVGNEEAKELSKHFDFKGKKPLVREIDSHQILHALKAHGDEEKELKRGQEALTLEDISEYENIVKNYDFKHIQDNGRIIYAKQVNGHHIVLEEVLSGQDKLRFFDMWKQKGQLNKEVLLSHSQRPNANLDQMTKRRMPSSDESITQPLFKSKEAREFLELVEGFHKLYKNDAIIAKNFTQGTASQLSTSIATSAEGAIKQKVVKGGFDPIFRLLPDGILFGLFSKQIQGGALRYHLKKALSRSLNYDDFKIKLEKELKRTNFNSNTSRLIDEFMQNLEDFNAEKEAKLARIREEEELQRAQELKRQEAIYKAQEAIYKAQEANNLKDILEAEESPLKEDFGVNFEGFKGKEAVLKLLSERKGQVKGAFYKEGLGDIDLVWGDENFGLRHILEQRTKQWGEEKALKFISHLNENIEKGQIVEVQKGRAAIKTDLTTIILDKKENNNFVLTAFRDRNNKKELESLNLSQSKTFTSENAEANAKESPVTSLNQESIIAQNAKNDEVLEAEVIEEVGLNEPMKFLEFQQRKLLTYIKENTPLRLLEHKKELKTRDILNFLEQSALNGKQKVFLMRNLERDLGKIELKIKENESVKAKIKNTYEISQSEAKELGEHFNFKGKKPLLRELRENEIKHALKSHGNKESEEARGNIAITLQDIEANYPKITQEFDEKFFTQKGVIYVKQVNGHHIVIEEALSGQDKLIFKTMWKTKGNYNKEVLLKNAKTSPYPQNADEAVRLETISKQELEQSNPQQSHLSTDESIPQNSEKLPFETKTLDEDKLSGDEVRLLANKIGEKSTMAYFKDYLLKMDKNFHARAKDIIREYYKIEPFRKELENQWENVKEAYKNGEMSLKEFKFLSRYKDEKSFLNQVAGVLWLQNDELVKNRGYTINKYGLTEQGKGDNYYQNLALEYGKAQTALKKWFYYIQKANKQAQRFFNKKELEDLRANEKGTKLEAKGSEDIIFTDKKAKEHTLTKETQKAWLEAFGLKSLDEEAIVEIPVDLKERLGKEIKLNKKDFEKLVKNKREKYIPQIKETFKEPEAVFIDENDDLIFAKSFNDKLFFVNVNRDYGEAFKALSLAPKKNNNLLNKLDKSKEILKLDSKLRDYTAQQAFTGVLSASNKSSGEIIPQIPKDNSQLNVLHTKIQQVRQQIAESRNPDKEYLHQVFKPDEIIELEKQYFNQAMPQEYKELIQDFPQLYEQRLANELKAYVKDTDVIQEVSAQLLNDFKDKSFKDTAKHAKLLLFNTLRDKAQELGFKELNINEPSFKVAFGKFQAKLKKGDIQDLSEHIAINSLQHDRLRIQEALNLTPLKEFGTNYAEFYRDGKGAVEKLLAEKQGQVAGAFYKEGLGEIDLVWGDSKKGLSHILERRTQDFINQGLEKGKAEYKVRELLSEIPQILENGKILSQNNDKIELITDKYTLVLGLRDDKKFIVTELIDKRNKKRLEAMQTGVGDSFTDEPLAKTPLSQNQQEIIPQQKIKFAMEKFNYDEKKAKDLLEWHKNSHALTKDENGLPKVFYHGTYSKFRVFRRVGKASQQGFFFTPSQKATEEYGDITLNTFLNIKNPFRADELKINKEADLQKWADILKLDYDKEKYESFKDLKTKLEKVKEATKKAGFKFHSASGGGVYVIDNKGRNSFINLEELDKENKRVVEAFKGLETEDIYFYYVVRNEFDLVLYALSKNDRYFHKSGRDEVKRVLEKLGYDGAVLNDTIITVFNSNQIKHIDNKGSFTDTKGNVTSKKPKDKEVEFSYFNEKSDNIYHSNPHLGAGLVGGVLNGVEQDEEGNLSFDPVKFAMGFLGGSGGSFALKKGFQILEKNPELKEKIINELADTLAQGFEKAREKYPLLSLLEPRYIVKNEKGRKIQAKTMLKELEREQKGLYNVAFNGKNASLIKQDLQSVESAIAFMQGTRYKGAKHERIKHLTDPSKEGYVTDLEFVNLGKSIREFLKNYEPFIDTNGARLYEWENKDKVRFRVVVNDVADMDSNPTTATEEIITFYSDRNLKEKMNFKNPLLKDTIAESTMQGEALSKELEKSFLDESGRIAYKALIHKAEVLPQSLNLKGFKQMIFNNDKTKQLNAENALIKTPVGEVKVNVLRAFNHYMKNGKNGNHKENRQALNATFMPTLLEPKFVTRDEEGTMYYYKPFISKDKEYHITSIAVKKNGNLDYATSYNATENRLRQMIKHNELVYEKD